jgi:hypothetical protein
MKNLMILSVLLLPCILRGQVINHFDNLDSKWHVAETFPNGNQQNPSFVQTTTTVFGFQGDTIVNSEQWFKLYSTPDSLFQNELVYRGLLREENDRVFYLDTLNQLDTLYDFSLNVGDSVLFDLYGMYPEWLQIIEVDNIQIDGQTYRRQIFAEPVLNAFDELNEVWIEGVGSIHGPLFPNNPVKFSQEIPDSMLVTCSFSDSQQVWQHPSYSNCYVNIVLSLNRLEALDLNIYPNPFSDRIIFENNKGQRISLSIINSIGQEVKRIDISDKNTSIDLSDLKDGIYVLRLTNGKGIKTLKMIKKH